MRTISATSSPCTSISTTKSKLVVLRALWLMILLIHMVCAEYYAFTALVYHTISNSLLSSHMEANRLSINVNHFPFLVGFFGTCSAVHVALQSGMLVRSAYRRSLFFRSHGSQSPGVLAKVNSLWKTHPASTEAKVREITAVPTSRLGAPKSRLDSTKESFQRAERIATRAWKWSFGATGFFGIGGKHFALMFLIRETIETVLQSLQAYTMSEYVPRVWLNRSAVAFVVVNCWSTPAIRHLLPPVPRLELILCLLVDILLDMASSIGVSTALGAIYLPYYSTTLGTFADDKWYDEAWVANLNSEFKLLFIQSWFDFGTRALFVATALLALDDVKLLAAAAAASVGGASGLAIRHRTESQVVKISRRFEKLVHVAMIIWGFVILGLHLSSAGGDATQIDCMVRVRPWLVTKTTCAAILIDCTIHDEMVGTATEIEALWSEYDAQAFHSVIIQNCPELHIPDSIRSFPQLNGLYIYTSALVEWSASAALTASHHPRLRQISLMFNNMTAACDASSSLPPGLLAHDFPQTLGTLNAWGITLYRLPFDLPDIWPRGMSYLLLADDLTTIPDVLLHMEPVQIDLKYNYIVSLPAALFEIPTLKWLDIGWNPLNELPEEVEPSPALLEINLAGTNVSSLPKWMTRESFLRDVYVVASETPLCAQLQSALDADSKALASKLCA